MGGNRWRKGDNEGEGDAAAQQPMRHGDRDAVYCTCHVTRPHCGQVNHRANAGTADLGLPVGAPDGPTTPPHATAKATQAKATQAKATKAKAKAKTKETKVEARESEG